MTFITAHWAMILSILAIVSTRPRRPSSRNGHYVQMAASLGTKLATSKDSTVTDAVSNLTGEAADLCTTI